MNQEYAPVTDVLHEQQRRLIELVHYLILHHHISVISITGKNFLDQTEYSNVQAQLQTLEQDREQLRHRTIFTSAFQSIQSYIAFISVVVKSHDINQTVINWQLGRTAGSIPIIESDINNLKHSLNHSQVDISIRDTPQNPVIAIRRFLDSPNTAYAEYRQVRNANLYGVRSSVLVDEPPESIRRENQGNAILLSIRNAPWLNEIETMDISEIMTQLANHYPSIGMEVSATLRGYAWKIRNLTSQKSFQVYDETRVPVLIDSQEIIRTINSLEKFFLP